MNFKTGKVKTRFIIGILLSLAVLFGFLVACTGEDIPHVYTVEHEGKEYTVDLEKKTILVDGDICLFDVSTSGTHVDFEVTYPNGSTYWWSEEAYGGGGGWSDDYDPKKYVAGDVLWDVLRLDEQTTPTHSRTYIILGLILLLLGIVHVAIPNKMWYISYGWRYKDAEPSDMALLAERAGGIIAIIVGVICLFI